MTSLRNLTCKARSFPMRYRLLGVFRLETSVPGSEVWRRSTCLDRSEVRLRKSGETFTLALTLYQLELIRSDIKEGPLWD